MRDTSCTGSYYEPVLEVKRFSSRELIALELITTVSSLLLLRGIDHRRFVAVVRFVFTTGAGSSPPLVLYNGHDLHIHKHT